MNRILLYVVSTAVFSLIGAAVLDILLQTVVRVVKKRRALSIEMPFLFLVLLSGAVLMELCLYLSLRRVPIVSLPGLLLSALAIRAGAICRAF